VPTVVIGTAGHIDHGKTSLLRALTGIDADRLPEERARGMTIEVGYAHLAFEDGLELDFVDVPGHDRLVGNMLVGAGEIDAALLVVAADDGPRPQTIEHLLLLDALGIDAGLAVVTKLDAVDPARAAAVVDQVRDLLAGTSLSGARVLRASSVSGEGIDAVRAALRDVRDAVVELQSTRTGGGGPLRLAIDRVFAVKGRGAVVTGSLRGGTIEKGATLRREPGGEAVRVREIQVHGSARDRHDGGRTALNLTGVAQEDLRRGDVLASGVGIAGTERMLVSLRPAADSGIRSAPGARAKLRLHIGTDQVDAALRRLPGMTSVAVLTLERPAATFVGDCGVVREPASGAVVGGVQVLDVRPPRGVSRRRMTPERLLPLIHAVQTRDTDRVSAAVVELHGAHAVALGSDGLRVELAGDVAAELREAAIDLVRGHHDDAPMSAGLPTSRVRAALLRRLRSLASIQRADAAAASAAVARLLDDLVSDGRLGRSAELLRDPARGHDRPAELDAAMDRLERLLAVAAPPDLDAAAAEAGCPPEGIRALVAEGRLTRLAADLAWATSTYHRLAAQALERARMAPLTPAAFRDATGTSRRYVLAILEDLDRREILARTAEGHVPGPRAPRPA